MMNYQNPFINPFAVPQPMMQPAVPVQVVKVNGENGARAYQIGPNSSALLLDESGLMVWLVTSDGAGYKTVSPYDIKPHQSAPAPDYGSLESRIKRLEEIINGNTADSSAAGRTVNNPATGPAADYHDQNGKKSAVASQPAYANEPNDAASYGNPQSVWRGREQGIE